MYVQHCEHAKHGWSDCFANRGRLGFRFARVGERLLIPGRLGHGRRSSKPIRDARGTSLQRGDTNSPAFTGERADRAKGDGFWSEERLERGEGERVESRGNARYGIRGRNPAASENGAAGSSSPAESSERLGTRSVMWVPSPGRLEILGA